MDFCHFRTFLLSITWPLNINFFQNYFYFTQLCALPPPMSVHYMCTPCPQKQETALSSMELLIYKDVS